MTRIRLDRLADSAMRFVEVAAYPMAPAPLLIDFFWIGLWPPDPWRLAIDASAGLLIVTIGLLMGYARRKVGRIDRLRGLLNEAIVHDLKNPMTAVMGCLSCVIEDSPEEDQRDRLLKLALHACRSQMTLLETIVDTARIEGGEFSVRKAEIKTHAMLDSCLDDMRGTAQHLKIELVDIREEPLPEEFSGDPDLLPRTISNLLHNAVKYTPPGGSVSLKVRRDQSGVVFEIRDTGIGIPASHIERLFNKYYRVEGGVQTARRGSGLGLYFCRMVVESHGGSIGVRSEIGRGTSVIFNIPQSSAGTQ